MSLTPLLAPAAVVLVAFGAHAQGAPPPAGASEPVVEAPAPEDDDATAAEPGAGSPTASSPTTTLPTATATSPVATTDGPGGTVVNQDPVDGTVQCPKSRQLLCWHNDVAAIWPRVRVRPGFEYVDADPQILYIGENDGFFLDSARIGVEGNIGDVVRFHLTIDAASLLAGAAPNQPVTPLLAAARDAWVAFTPSRWFVLQAGQMNMPADYETGDDVSAIIPFTSRSVLANGVRAGHGNAVLGLSPGRQIGVVLGSADGAAIGDVPLEYRLGISNGNGQNLLGNDNKLPAGYLRLGTGFGTLLRLGVGGRFNPRTVGTLPNLYTESDAVGFADIAVTVAGLEFVAEAMARQTSLTTLVPDGSNAAGEESAWGGTTWLAYKFGLGSLVGAPVFLKPAVRLSFYDPSSAFSTDQLLETTVALRIDGDPARMPLSFFIDYTFLNEVGDVVDAAATRDLANNRLTALLQLEL